MIGDPREVITGDAMLSAVFADPSLIDSLSHLPAAAMPTDFSRAVWSTMLQLHREGLPCDLATTVGRLVESDNAAAMLGDGWGQRLFDLCSGQVMTSDPVGLAGKMIDQHTARTMRLRVESVIADPYADAATIAARLQEIAADADVVSSDEPIDICDLRQAHPRLRRPIIEGLLREGEIVNVISASKVGKSWLTYGLALSKACGLDWLGRFRCTPGNVLLIDNELHAETLAYRICEVAEAMGLRESDYRGRMSAKCLRGQWTDIHGMGQWLSKSNRGKYELVIIDAMYRAMPQGFSENDNAQMTQIYNQLERYADNTGAGIAGVHHSSKGDQTGKAVTDVGSGAGAQSRAADSHLILRPHEQEACVVLNAAVRSFAPVEPMVLKWEFPLWTAADDLDPNAIKRPATRGDERQTSKDREGCETIVKGLRAKGPSTSRRLREFTGFGVDRLNRLLRQMVDDERLTVVCRDVAGNQCDEYHLAPHLQPSDGGGGRGGLGVVCSSDVPPDHVGGGGLYESPKGDVIPPDHPHPPEQQTTGKRRPRSKSDHPRRQRGKARRKSKPTPTSARDVDG
ncbi:MAG: AAA family ATPase [Planctomycetaceae bacterium]|nr:AAA family ATPase [Planctomycetaceae bacterium]